MNKVNTLLRTITYSFKNILSFQYSGDLAHTKKGVNLAKGLIGIKKLHNLNLSTSSCGKIVKAVEFHPTSSLALIAGISGRASIVQV